MEHNPLVNNWDTPHQTPPFGAIRTAHFAPAVREAIAIAQRKTDAIARQSEAPTFANTIEAMELATELLDRVVAVMLNLNECDTTPELQQTVMELMPEITRYENSIWMDERLYARVDSLWKHCQELGFSAEQRELTGKCHRRFVAGGVNLDAAKKRRFAANAEELSTLTEQFGHNALDDTNDFVLHLAGADALAGLPDNVVAAAHEEALARDLDGWVFTLQAPSYRPFLTYADRRDLRERMWRAYNSRGNRGNAADNNAVIGRIADLRREQAQMLGFPHYAAYSLEKTMARDTATVTAFLDGLREACMPYAESDLLAVQRFAKESGAGFGLQNWDFAYYSEKLKQAHYGFDSELLRPYLQLDKVRQGIFDLYSTLYGLTFRENDSIEVYHPDVKAYEVFDGTRFMGVLYLDMFPRAGKRSGAWMTEFRCQSHIGGSEVRPLIQVVCNFSKPTGDKPALLSFDEFRTFMHEMGHAMHGMLSEVHYPSLSGTNVKRDFVEMPSQLMENWCLEPEFLDTFAHHYQSGGTIPSEYVDKLRRSQNFLAGWLCLRQLNFGTVDMAFHTLEAPLAEGTTVEQFEHAAMSELLPAVEGCCTSTAFTHIFAGGYAAGYYGYKWAEVLDADIFSRFKADGIFNRDTAAAFRRQVLSQGGSEHPSVLFRNFMGREPDNGALLRRCGFSR